jgi:hypothetical protein
LKCHFVRVESDNLTSEYGRCLVESLTSFGFDLLLRRMRVLDANTVRAAYDRSGRKEKDEK